MDIWISLGTSAVVAATVSGLFLILTQRMLARARRKEALFAMAMEFAKANRELVLKAVEAHPGSTAEIRDLTVNAVYYYRLLEHLWDKDRVPPNLDALYDQVAKEFPVPPARIFNH